MGTAEAASGSGATPITTTKAEVTTREADRIHFDKVPSLPYFSQWKIAFRKKVASASPFPDAAMAWAWEVDDKTFEELEDSGPFATLDYKISVALGAILEGDLARQAKLYEERLDQDRKVLKGRQIAKMIFDSKKIRAKDGLVLEIVDLVGLSSGTIT